MRPQGFTVLELMVTMAIVAILLTTAVPALKDYGWNLRMNTTMDVLLTDLKLARSRAISHNIQTVICPANDKKRCSGHSNWQEGWIVFTDINGDRNKQDGEPLLKHASAIELLEINSSRSRSFVRFYPNGSAPGSNTSIRFCDKRGSEHAQAISVSNSGRIRLKPKTVKHREKCP